MSGGRGHTHRTIGRQQPLIHSRFWESIRLKDPCPEKSAFLDGCPVTCIHTAEHPDQSPVYCTESYGHADTDRTAAGCFQKLPGEGQGVVHHFVCQNHKCNYPCSKLRNGKSCTNTCKLNLGHLESNSCTCKIPHQCGTKCSAENCSKPCRVNLEEHHENSHIYCMSDLKCLAKCEHCEKECARTEHLHQRHPQEDLLHHCGNDHVCHQSKLHNGSKCQVDPEANCQMVVTQAETPRTQVVSDNKPARQLCARLIPVGKKHHTGLHCHDRKYIPDQKTSVQHYCNERCLMCGNCCTLAAGHELPHKTHHGKVLPTLQDSWVVMPCRGEQFKERRSVWQKKQQNLTCTEVCEAAERGHYHVRVCRQPSKCVTKITTEGTHHFENVQCDITSHGVCWGTISQFHDPSSTDQKRSYGLCGSLCPHPDHRASTRKVKAEYCSQPCLHRQIEQDSANTRSYQENGHTFDWHPC